MKDLDQLAELLIGASEARAAQRDHARRVLLAEIAENERALAGVASSEAAADALALATARREEAEARLGAAKRRHEAADQAILSARATLVAQRARLDAEVREMVRRLPEVDPAAVSAWRQWSVGFYADRSAPVPQPTDVEGWLRADGVRLVEAAFDRIGPLIEAAAQLSDARQPGDASRIADLEAQVANAANANRARVAIAADRGEVMKTLPDPALYHDSQLGALCAVLATLEARLGSFAVSARQDALMLESLS